MTRGQSVDSAHEMMFFWRENEILSSLMASSSSTTTRFAELDETEIQQLLDDKDSKNTKRATKASKAVLELYLKEKRIQLPQNSEELAVVLKRFYAEARKVDGSLYTKSSLCCIRFGLSRYYKSLFNVDIIKDIQFEEANKVYQAQCTALKKRGLAKTEHKLPISDEDIKKLYESGVFNTDTPATLQNKVFFEIIFYFCRRGRQNLRELKPSDFAIKLNGQGQRYVIKTTDELTKNHRVEDRQADEGGMMIANGGSNCPVYSFEKYLSHLNPANQFLFQRPKCKIPDSMIWYDNMVVGANTLGSKMKTLSKEAKLSAEYTNHSIRATTITILDRSGYEARHIMSVSGHRNESSIKSYSKTGESTKTKMANCLMSVTSGREENVANETVTRELTIPRAVEASGCSSEDIVPILTNSQEELIMRDFNYQSTMQSTSKQFNFYNCKVDFHS